MTRQRAIYLKCLYCSGNVTKEVLLCHLFDCALWQFRCGYSTKTVRYKKRIRNIPKQYPGDAESLKNMGIDMNRFLETK